MSKFGITKREFVAGGLTFTVGSFLPFGSPPAFAAALVSSGLTGSLLPPLRWLFVLIVLSYGVADVSASFSHRRQHGWRTASRLLVIHPVLHLSYGLGFLAGLARFAGRPGRDRPGADFAS